MELDKKGNLIFDSAIGDRRVTMSRSTVAKDLQVKGSVKDIVIVGECSIVGGIQISSSVRRDIMIANLFCGNNCDIRPHSVNKLDLKNMEIGNTLWIQPQKIKFLYMHRINAKTECLVHVKRCHTINVSKVESSDIMLELDDIKNVRIDQIKSDSLHLDGSRCGDTIVKNTHGKELKILGRGYDRLVLDAVTFPLLDLKTAAIKELILNNCTIESVILPSKHECPPKIFAVLKNAGISDITFAQP